MTVDQLWLGIGFLGQSLFFMRFLVQWIASERQGESVLPRAVRSRLAVEMGGSLGWDCYVGPDGDPVTMSSFGSSAPLANLQEKFGFTLEHVCQRARDLMEKNQ